MRAGAGRLDLGRPPERVGACVGGVGRGEQWSGSPAYREILRLRADHIPGDLVMVEGCAPDHDSAALAAALRAAA